ncbi:MAG: DUF302 domain-containing protein [Gammaproteobacteria bacterium]|nr:DUF302 domain-containing protein [Gammaproteobacteria bacterium]NNJ97277.1 DUF302 domain-containing protein [Gammaproteobacteria bacterium]
MSYYFSTSTDLSFEDAITKTTEELSKQGFGVLSEIDVKTTLKKKIDVDIPKYVILGACNPKFAHRALLTEEHIGTMLPCNVVVRENEHGQTEVFAVDPISSMNAVDNPELGAIAHEVQQKLKTVIANI